MDEIYANVEEVKSVDPRPSANQPGRRRSERRFHGSVVLFLGLLSVFLLVGLIALGVAYRDSVRDSSTKLSAIKANLTAERDLLNANLTETTKELDRLQSLSKRKKSCPAGWRLFSCSCFLFSTQSDSWEKARQDCRTRGADLVIIDSYGEQEFLKNIIKHDTWIGLNDREKEGTWKWTDETLPTRTYWLRGQPNQGGGNPEWGDEDCAHFVHGLKIKESWNDLRCDASMKWICEKMA